MSARASRAPQTEQELAFGIMHRHIARERHTGQVSCFVHEPRGVGGQRSAASHGATDTPMTRPMPKVTAAAPKPKRSCRRPV